MAGTIYLVKFSREMAGARSVVFFDTKRSAPKGTSVVGLAHGRNGLRPVDQRPLLFSAKCHPSQNSMLRSTEWSKHQ